MVRYGPVRAVDGVSFRADAGAVTALLGPNGAGKTTTVETLEGYRRPSSGTVRVLGLDPGAQHAAVVGRVGVMLQQGGIAPGIRPEEVLALFAAFYPDPLDPGGLLARVGLDERRRTPYRRLSGGEQQRLSLALALVGRPEVVFLDEPTSGIDPTGRQVVRQVIRELRADGVAVVVTTHDLDEVERLADHVVIVDHGRVLATGSPGELVRGERDEIRFGAPPGLDAGALSARLDARVSEVGPGEYLVETAPTPDAVAALTGWLAEQALPLADLRAGRQSLEDVFVRLTGDAAQAHADARAAETGDGAGAGRRRSVRGRSRRAGRPPA